MVVSVWLTLCDHFQLANLNKYFFCYMECLMVCTCYFGMLDSCVPVML